MLGTGFHPDMLHPGVKITRLVTDSRMVAPGDTFVAYPGGQPMAASSSRRPLHRAPMR
jgi:UDP-N-acetylmuramyl pentapeptide synthase